jgi:hypothetical protein
MVLAMLALVLPNSNAVIIVVVLNLCIRISCIDGWLKSNAQYCSTAENVWLTTPFALWILSV